MKIITVVGTRPELIKLSEVIKKIDLDKTHKHILVHTGQNYTPQLKDFFFNELEIRKPDYYLNVDTSNYSNEVSDIIKKTDEIFKKEKPDILLILGDTYSCLSIMPAVNRGIKVFHMEAGLRAWDKRMPEQRNRVLIDHMSDILLPFNKYHKDNLIRENIHPSKIFVTGNPTFEVLKRYEKKINSSSILSKLKLKKKKYFLLTFHRSENVDNPKIFKRVLECLNKIAINFSCKIVYPIHPRSKQKINELKLNLENFIIIDALGYYDYNKLTKECYCILSDSGTAPEEGMFFDIPSVTIRDTSERYEVVETGINIVSGTNCENIDIAIKTALKTNRKLNFNFEQHNSVSDIVNNLLNSNFTHYF